jgi:hypothetical protein
MKAMIEGYPWHLAIIHENDGFAEYWEAAEA